MRTRVLPPRWHLKIAGHAIERSRRPSASEAPQPCENTVRASRALSCTAPPSLAPNSRRGTELMALRVDSIFRLQAKLAASPDFARAGWLASCRRVRTHCSIRQPVFRLSQWLIRTRHGIAGLLVCNARSDARRAARYHGIFAFASWTLLSPKIGWQPQSGFHISRQNRFTSRNQQRFRSISTRPFGPTRIADRSL